MTTAFVIGNGTSRRELNLNSLRSHGKIYGCNALYREFTPDVLVATDQPIATVIIESGYPLINKFYTRKQIARDGAKHLEELYQGYSSGPNAVALAALSGARQIYLLGFDMGPSATGQFNNVYADTEFYKTSVYPPTYTGNWIKQLIKIAQDFPQTQFIRVHGSLTAEIKDFSAVPNLIKEDLSVFVNRINNQQKDV